MTAPEAAKAQACPENGFALPPIGSGAGTIVAPGVLWIRQPISLIPSVNVWAIADGHGWAIVDTGMHSAVAIDAWEAVLRDALEGRPITRIVVTHFHPDHCGMARWLQDRFAAPLMMTHGEYMAAIAASTDRRDIGPPEEWLAFYRRAGWDEEALAYYRDEFGLFGRITLPVPDTYQRLVDGDDLTIGDRRWKVMVGSGHSPEHASLYSAGLNVLISGDQVLPRISSNVSVLPREPCADPLAEWYVSLRRLRRDIPEGALILPSHGEPFTGISARIDAILGDHDRRLATIVEWLAAAPRRTVDLFPALFRRTITNDSIRMATGETLAHLRYLERQGRVVSSLRDNIDWWQPV